MLTNNAIDDIIIMGGENMDIATLQSLISTLGYPIVVSGVLMYYINKKEESHKQEMDKMSEAVNNNTIVLQKLIDKIGE